MEDFFSGTDVTIGIKSQEPVVGRVHFPFGIRRRGVVVEHAAAHHHQIVVRVVRAGEQIVIQPVDLLKVVVIDNDIGTALERFASGDILPRKDAKPVDGRFLDDNLDVVLVGHLALNPSTVMGHPCSPA